MLRFAGPRRGIAIISVLLVLAAVLVLGVGAVYLTRVNLSISGNVRSGAIARSNAEAGLEVALIRLEQQFRASFATDPQSAALPATLSLPSATGPGYTPQFTLVSYARDTGNTSSAALTIRGVGPSSAEYVTEALVVMFPGEPEFPPGFGFGLASEGQIFVNGNSSYINAGIHGNGGFSLTGNVGDDFFVCVARNSLGVCTATESIPLQDAPVSASPGATLCSPAELCDGGAPRTLVSPIQVNPDFAARRRGAIADASSMTGTATGTATFDGVAIDCDLVISSAPTASALAALLPASGSRPGFTLCSTTSGTLTFPSNFDTNGMNIVSAGPVVMPHASNGAPRIRNSTIVTMAGSVTTTGNANQDSRATIESSRLFSQGDLNFLGNGTSVSGVTTLASNGNVGVDGGAPAVTTSVTPSVGFAIIASGNVTINGNANWYVAATVGGTFTQNGTATVYGVVEARNTITINGGIDIDSGLPIVNDDTQTAGPPRIGVVSIR